MIGFIFILQVLFGSQCEVINESNMWRCCTEDDCIPCANIHIKDIGNRECCRDCHNCVAYEEDGIYFCDTLLGNNFFSCPAEKMVSIDNVKYCGE